MMNRAKWVVAIVSVVLAGSAIEACAIEVTERRTIDGEPGAVWGKVGAFCAIGTWHPAVAQCEETKDGDTVWRTLTLKEGGAIIKEKQTATSATSYTYVITESPLPVKNYTATFSVEPRADTPGSSYITWTAEFEANGKPDDEAKYLIQGIFDGGLDNLKATAGK